MNDLRELESLSVTCIVDNDCDTMSSGITGIDGFDYQSEGLKHTDAEHLCVAAHGLSLLLTATTGDCDSSKHTLLLDAGPTPGLWMENSHKLGINFGEIEAIVLSHYHYDHSGGLRGAIPLIVQARAAQSKLSPLLVDLHTSGIISRGRRVPSNNMVNRHSPTNPSAEEIRGMGANVELNALPHTLLDHSFYVSGSIPRDTFLYEKGMSSTHVTLKDGQWESDTSIDDERYVACNIRGRGLVIFSSCSHAGINNVCDDAMKKLRLPIFAVIGGLHLGGDFNHERIIPTVADLQRYAKPRVILGGHCTGWRGKVELAKVFPLNYQPLAVGGTYNFKAKE